VKAAEMQDLTDADLSVKLKDSRAELFNLRFQLATGQLDNPNRIGVVKKDIARLLTEIRVREIKAAADAKAS
jgi:large subunit ribosomal protein L29